MTLSIFCPQCSTLLLDQRTCPACHWQRPPTGGLGTLVSQAALGRELARPPVYPVRVGAYAYLPAADGTVLAAALEPLRFAWEYAQGEHVTAHALASDGARIFATSSDTTPMPSATRALLALDAESGQVLWRFPTAAHSLSMPAVADGVVYVASSDGFLSAIDATSGECRWSVEHPNWGPAAPAVDAGFVCVGGYGDTLVIYNAADGSEHWRVTGGGWFATPIAIAEGTVYAWRLDNTLSAFDAATKRLRWRIQGERGKGFTSPPVVAGERVYIGSRVYRASGDQRQRTYALLALNAADGTEIWRSYTEQYVLAPVTGTEDEVLYAASDGTLCALDAATGSDRWRVMLDVPVVTQPLVVGDLVYVALGDGTLQARRWQAPAVAHDDDPRLLLEQGAYAEAAAAYALRGDYAAAAYIYAAQLAAPLEAAQLYEHGGSLAQAAAQYEQAGKLPHARELFEAANDTAGLARILERLGEVLPAAQTYAQHGAWAAAARLYEQVGEQSRAAEYYEQAGELAQALRLRVHLAHWEAVGSLAERVGDDAQAALAYERLQQPARAAAAYERAAQQVLAQPGPDDEQVAHLFEQASRCYQQSFDEERATSCSRQVQRYRRLPEVAVDVEVHEAFIEFEWNTATIKAQNIGYGPAINICIVFEGPFDMRGDFAPSAGPEAAAHLDIPLLQPDKVRDFVVYLRPQREQRGKVPLHLRVAYEDISGEHQTHTQISPVQVSHEHDTASQSTPPPIHVQTRPAARDTSARADERTAALPELVRLPLTLRFVLHGDTIQVLWEADALGRRTSAFVPPFDDATLPLIVKALDAVQHPDHPRSGPQFSAEEQAALAARSLWAQGRVVPDIAEHVGHDLYRAMVADTEGDIALRTMRDYATAQGLPLTYCFRFPPQAPHLAALPWEMLRDQQGVLLLSRGQLASCIRYLDLEQALPPAIAHGERLHILAIAPRAGIPDSIRTAERATRKDAWERLTRLGIVEMDELSPATPASLIDRIQRGPRIDIVHFYGHGRYQDGAGALLFDDDDGGERWVGAAQLATALGTAQARLLLLHACQSAMISDKGLLTGVAPALSAAGVPAVIAMHLTVRVPAATRFAEIVYRNLARGASLQRAVSLARQALYVEEHDGASWYVPTVMIRTRETGPLHLMAGQPGFGAEVGR